MWYSAVLLLFCTTSPVLISSLQCYSCTDAIMVEYLVTNNTVPSFSQCQVIQAISCSITLTWYENINMTVISVDSRNSSSMQDTSGDTITAMALMEDGPYGSATLFAHNLVFSCTSNDTCNSETTLKELLSSLTIEDQFREELLPLIQVIYPFNPTAAACVNFRNTTVSCLPVDLADCQRCEITLDEFATSTPEICATCHRNSVDVNIVMHSSTFSLNNRTRLNDHVHLGCQTKGCNSIANINQIFKASNITFNFSEFFRAKHSMK